MKLPNILKLGRLSLKGTFYGNGVSFSYCQLGYFGITQEPSCLLFTTPVKLKFQTRSLDLSLLGKGRPLSARSLLIVQSYYHCFTNLFD